MDLQALHHSTDSGSPSYQAQCTMDKLELSVDTSTKVIVLPTILRCDTNQLRIFVLLFLYSIVDNPEYPYNMSIEQNQSQLSVIL